MVVEFDFMPKHETDVDLESVWVNFSTNLWKKKY